MEGIRAGAIALDIIGVLDHVGDFLAGLDRDLQIMGIGGLCLLLLWSVVRRRRAATAKHRALRRQYKKLAKAGVAEWERPYRLFTTRDGWEVLPDDFLMELASRLIGRDKVIEFMLMAEDFDQEQQEELGRLASGDPETAMGHLSTFLTDLADTLPEPEAVAMLGLALQIEPANHLALIDLATQHYVAKRFAQALPLLEQAIPLGQRATVEQPREEAPAVGRAVAARSFQTPGFTFERMRDILKIAGEMYEDCLKRAGPKRA